MFSLHVLPDPSVEVGVEEMGFRGAFTPSLALADEFEEHVDDLWPTIAVCKQVSCFPSL
jgi:hypothetical protein